MLNGPGPATLVSLRASAGVDIGLSLAQYEDGSITEKEKKGQNEGARQRWPPRTMERPSCKQHSNQKGSGDHVTSPHCYQSSFFMARVRLHMCS